MTRIQTNYNPLTRRQMINRAAGTAAALALNPALAPLLAAPEKRRFKIGACDWSVGNRGTPEALSIAKEIGLDGVQVSLGTLKNDMHLRQAAVQKEYKETAKRTGVEIASLAIGEMNNIPYKSDPRPIEWVRDSIGVMKALGVKVVLLAFFGKGDLKDDKAGTDEHIVALVGDAALTCGTTYEAMNNVAHTTKRLIVILNDNEWSIDRNVGAISRYLNRIVTNPTYNRLHKDFDSLLQKVPFGKGLLQLERKAEEAAKGVFFPSMIFEELGFHYLGPIDGHDLKTLIANLEYCKQADRPILLHVRTTKGKGAPYAIENPEKYHGCAPYDPDTGEGQPAQAGTPPAWQDVFGEIMIKFARTHSKLVGITGAMPSGTGLSKLRDEMPERYYDVGIAEEHAVLFACGMATMGWRPVVAIYSTFLQRSFDMIMHDVSLQNLPVIFCMDRAGLSAGDGATHHGLYDIAYTRIIPNTVLMQPKDEDEFQDMFATALALNQPVFIRYPRGPAAGVQMKEHAAILQVGKAEVLQHGRDVAIFSYGNMLPLARDAAQRLGEQGLSVALINARFAKPLDVECIERYARQCKALLTFEDHALAGGFGDAVIECLSDLRLQTPVARVGWPDRFIEWASNNDTLRKRHGVTADVGVDKVMTILREQRSDPRFQVVSAGRF
ncbi:MAG: 1-deoxy-D-xylulose-5-phosphate synthase [Verrucomicrobiae bacterium]|nr:1-deoxy-D-xylulose-5-phosphate synthase [Verrucomicrobiae bacterium]